MLGRPLRIEPLFMNAWAGSWLICSVTIERMMLISSAIPAMCGKRFEISWSAFPVLFELGERPAGVQRRVLQLGELLALGERLGERLAVYFFSRASSRSSQTATDRRPCKDE